MKAAVLLLLALPIWPAHSQTRTTTTATTVQPLTTQEESIERIAAQSWGLTVEDYRRYQALMKGMRGAISDPRISPVEVLGIHARDDAERRRYAEMFARMMADDTQRVLQFQVEYDRAFRRLYPKLAVFTSRVASRETGGQSAAAAAPPLSPVPQPAAETMSRAPLVAAGDRLLVFTSEDCKNCDELVRRSTALAHRDVIVDLYLVAARSADDAQRYARRLAIDPQLVVTRRVTLNIDGGTFARVLPHRPALPAVVRMRGQDLAQLAVSEL